MAFYAIDCEKGDGPELAREYGIRGYPTYIVLNHDKSGKIDHWLGFDGAEEWGGMVENDIADPVIIGERLTRYEESPSAHDAAVLGRIRGAESEFAQAVEYYRSAQKLEPALAGAYQYEIFDAIADGVRREAFTRDDAIAAADLLISSDNPDPVEVIYVAFQMSGFLKNEEDPNLRWRYLTAAVRLSEGSDDEKVLKYRPDLLVDHALVVEGNANKAVSLKRANMPEGWKEDASHLNGFAWWCYESGVNLAEAEELARLGIDLAEPGRQKASILDTAAEICNARGSCEDAVELIKMAIAEAPEEKYFQDQLKRFEEILAGTGDGVPEKL